MTAYAQAYSKTHRNFGTGSLDIRATRHIHGKTSVAERAAPAAAYRREGNPRRQATAAQISAPKGAHAAPNRSANKAAHIAMREPKMSEGDHAKLAQKREQRDRQRQNGPVYYERRHVVYRFTPSVRDETRA